MGAIDEIRHVVVLMLENQSFDRLLGYVDLGRADERLAGLTGGESNPMSPPGDMTPVPVSRATEASVYVTDPSPGHDFEDVNQQLFGERTPRAGAAPSNHGFVLNYSWQVGDDGHRLGPRGRAIMACLDPGLLPAITTLARNFVVCDHWFSSVPGPTWPNRFFAHAGTSNGLLITPETPGEFGSQFSHSPYRMRSIFENLAERGLSWAVYFDDYAQAFALRNLHAYADNFRKFERFAEDVQHGALPAYSFIEPRSFSAPGAPANDQHPPHHLLEGDKLIATVYDTLRGEDAVWRRSLLVVLYDEHGGFYDHVPPPAAVPPESTPAPGSRFAFDRLGVRVPAILVSPWVAEGHADHTVYDHTSLLATIKKMFDLPRFLTARDASARTFDHNFLDAARAVTLTNLSARVPSAPTPAPGRRARRLSAYQRSLRALAQALASSGPDVGSDAGAAGRARAFLDQAP